ncbi:3361_t:CDS:2, partial [Funneliformis geosporum]
MSNTMFNTVQHYVQNIVQECSVTTLLEWMWKRSIGKFEIKEEIIKWKYRRKIEVKSENDFIKKYPIKALEEGEEDLEEKEYMGGPIKIKISAEDDFTSSFLKLPDALHCQELLVNQSIINDYREVASIAYVSPFDTHYCINEMKVQNLLRTYAIKRDIIISTRISENIEKGKYPDVYVFSPKKGIESIRPVTGLDFASLYS